MGALCGGHDAEIGRYMDEESRQKNNVTKETKLLLLGPGSSGKSTLFRALQSAHIGVNDQTLLTAVPYIRHGMVEAIKILLKQSMDLYNKNSNLYSKCWLNIENDDTLSLHADICHKYESKTFFDEFELKGNELESVGKSIEYIWNLSQIKFTFDNRSNNFALEDNLDFFLDKANIVFNENYMPTQEDYLKTKERTVGMTDYLYHVAHANNAPFRVVDVGGQRCDRGKWITQFDGVDGLIYVAALSDYDGVLFEDCNVNSMLESTNLFEDTVNKKVFNNSTVILMLNKDDIFVKKLRIDKIPLSSCFSKEGNWPNANEYFTLDPDKETYEKFNENSNESNILFEKYHKKCIEFIFNIFECRNKVKHRIISKHITTATQSKIVERVFNSVQMQIISKNLHKAQLVDMTKQFAPTNSQDSKSNSSSSGGNGVGHDIGVAGGSGGSGTTHEKRIENDSIDIVSNNKLKQKRVPSFDSNEVLPSTTSSIIKPNDDGDHDVIQP